MYAEDYAMSHNLYSMDDNTSDHDTLDNINLEEALDGDDVPDDEDEEEEDEDDDEEEEGGEEM